jgi:hypothetical protein
MRNEGPQELFVEWLVRANAHEDNNGLEWPFRLDLGLERRYGTFAVAWDNNLPRMLAILCPS